MSPKGVLESKAVILPGKIQGISGGRSGHRTIEKMIYATGTEIHPCHHQIHTLFIPFLIPNLTQTIPSTIILIPVDCLGGSGMHMEPLAVSTNSSIACGGGTSGGALFIGLQGKPVARQLMAADK